MWTAIALAVLGVIRKGADLLLGRRRREERAAAEEVGGMKQRHADDQEALEAKDDQLNKAVRRRPGDARRRLRKRSF